MKSYDDFVASLLNSGKWKEISDSAISAVSTSDDPVIAPSTIATISTTITLEILRYYSEWLDKCPS